MYCSASATLWMKSSCRIAVMTLSSISTMAEISQRAAPCKRIVFSLPATRPELEEGPASRLNESYQRGCQEKFFPLPLRREMDVVACLQPKPGWWFLLDGFMTRWSFHALGSG